ncbi:MAG: hypothetical protein A2X61_16345 [Ignavibacteria bacterium GWB2_35_12]|nr:MAG: hypothetical protein A2X63_14175 [Ignavibacteria bacterium GWA2_35_8]OGU38445.1 MAG: hypothetical protein A2X61_16345 [Ignavibacteria bacterium GWB2_35_12]OGU95287.1 MAG: hypothetical protein A2220_07570 [Ignavibacteria bacterium RIFOXYA2_FULL_35_10]OGV22463.1 MAG: hypothetical protein A2475_04505 [Ignavibacteria bacterium RIFOXYC2_FULL_35_21]
MIRLLLLLLIIIGIIAIIYSVIKRIIKRFLGSVHTNENKTKRENDKKKSRIIYKRDDIVVMKGDAPENTDGNP